ncbi:unnamed protein product [Sphagnum tenellum]
MFSITMALSAWSFFCFRVYTLHIEAKSQPIPINVPLIIDPTSPSCSYLENSLARLEPPSGMFMGYGLNWTASTPIQMNAKLQHNMAVPMTFLQIDPTKTPAYDVNMLNWFGQQTAFTGGFLLLTIEPLTPDFSTISDEIMDTLARQCRDINAKLGVPILMRFGHEMNGDWTQYGLKPSSYITGFRRMASFIRSYTNVTAMLWSPNVGISYPFTTTGSSMSQIPTISSDPANFHLLDTNNDGVIDAGDDPYMPYYPGDDVVDWVGLSLYYYPDTPLSTSALNPVISPAGFFEAFLTGNGTLAQSNAAFGIYNASARNFYNNFSVVKNKPLAISESATPYFVGTTLATELQVKQAWYQQTLNSDLRSSFPKLKVLVNFEQEKLESGFVKNWEYVDRTQVTPAYVQYLDQQTGLLWADGLKFTCAGSINFS